MEENFDKKLSNKIKVVIENQKLPYNPEHWDMLLVKKKEKRRFLVLWRYAATLLTLLAVGSLSKFYLTTSNSEKNIEQKTIISERNDSLKKVISNDSEKSFIVNENVDSFIDIDTGASKANSFYSKKIQIKKVPKSQVISNKKFIAKGDKKNSSKEDYRNDFVSEKETIKDKSDVKANDNIFVDQNIIAKNDSLKDINDVISSNAKDKTDIKKNRSRIIKIGVNISSEVNYNQEVVSSNVGFGGGVSMDYPISKKIDIYSGILYTNQKINGNDYDLLYDAGPGIVDGNNTQQTSEKATLKGVVIPVNLKYNFSVNKIKIFVSGGVSSTYYFEENIESEYIVSTRTETITQDSYGNNIVQYKLTQSKEEVITSNSNNFNFANVLNLSMGIEFPLKKQQKSIVLEPYFKYSIRPVTQENIDFSSAGIFLRYNFNFYKK